MHNKRNACLAVALTFNTRRLWGFNELRLKRILFRLVLWGQFFKCISLVWVAQNSFMNILSDAQSVFHLDEFFAILCCYFICFSCLRSRYFFLLLYRKTCWKRLLQAALRSRSRIPKTTGGRSRIFLSDSGSPTGLFFTSYSYVRNPNTYLLKWYNFFWNFCWNREFLLCTMISIDC